MPKHSIGVLALQGDYAKHLDALRRAGASAHPVRTVDELNASAGLIIPGGESTTMLRLLHRENLMDAIKAYGAAKPIFGTCAGAILLAQGVHSPSQESLGLMDIDVERNAYGRQLDSRVVEIDDRDGHPFEAVFIRAPIIRRTGAGVSTLASYRSDPVLVDDGLHMAATFHPELTSSDGIHSRFLDRVRERTK